MSAGAKGLSKGPAKAGAVVYRYKAGQWPSVWYAYALDVAGNQTGDAVSAASEKEAKLALRDAMVGRAFYGQNYAGDVAASSKHWIRRAVLAGVSFEVAPAIEEA